MNWDYISGLFDGEGHVSVIVASDTVKAVASFSCSDKPLAAALESFLTNEGFHPHQSDHKNPLGKSHDVRLRSWPEAHYFARKILPTSVAKHRQLEILIGAYNMHKWLRETKRGIIKNRDRFEPHRQALHRLAHKGRKTLKPIQALS